ncbi:MAG: undecaprenyl-diphosphate phosphatase [Oscillospiraceae bacterium]|jgi:undecaprenyl-diphosphatase|nr:undecaprenyl-diphosphate phosphatase [Oscillospiraceae bacterium]
MLLELLKAVIFGLVEGVTEWLPVSSTGHMILLDKFLKLDVSPEFWAVFLVVLQLAAALSVAAVYFKRLFPISHGGIDPKILSLWGKILLACLPAAVIGLLFDEKLNALFYNWQTVSVALIFYGVLFIIVEKTRKSVSKIDGMSQLSVKSAFFIGMFQLLSLIPGTSRSGATILGAVLLGASRTVAADFSFFLALPVMLGASLLKLTKFGFSFSGAELAILLTGAASSFLVSLAAIKFLTGYVKKHDFKAFGVYRAALGLAVMIYFALAA